MSLPNILYRQTALAEIRPLRTAVLRPASTILVFPNDDLPSPQTWHFGAFLEAPASEQTIACATFLSTHYENAPAWQLRGMAVDPQFRARGIGGKLLDFAQPLVTAQGPKILWCNARLAAIPFYQRHGWQTTSETFDVPGAGPHRRMHTQAP